VDQASQQSVSSGLASETAAEAGPCPRITIHFSVTPRRTVEWRVRADSELHVTGAQLWVTRLSHDYDYWLQPGDTLRLRRGEHLWMSVDGELSGNVSLTSRYGRFRPGVRRWFALLAGYAGISGSGGAR
jgi:Protein of unknown function (DUF2917)